MNIEIANRLVTLRKKNGLSQEELADRIGISRQAVSKWERAESSPDTDNLIALARLYNVSLDELLEASDESLENENFARQTQQRQENTATSFANECKGEKGKWNSFPYPIIVTIIYLIIGFAFGWWHPGWILFVTIPVYYIIAEHMDKYN
jgi:Predicted transcriptional regulators